ncbi:MAG: RagB/SusD family nutrient uptake outer membrane protein, partial [Bacteroidetes bacterium]|nr:RagB/SusD family nutrient uptake outer membrane protein [Bacteroidota bacterium]
MKKIIIYLALTTPLFFSLGACKKFLAESSQDEVRPTTTEDLTQLLVGTAYPYTTAVDTYTDMLTDDIQCNGVSLNSSGVPEPTLLPYLNNGTMLFTFNPVMFDRHADGSALLTGQDSWQIYYKLINGCNLAIDYIDKVSGSTTDKNAILGQALFLRAFYYLKLVTLYGRPYNGAGVDPTGAPGVPLILSDIVSDARPARNSLAEVYNQIEAD